VGLAQEQPPARSEQARHDTGPAPDVGQPADRADAGVDDVETRLAKDLDGGVHVALHELDVDTRERGQTPCLLHRGRREVRAGHVRAQPRQRHRVGADVALQVDAAQTRDVAEPRQVEAHAVRQVTRVLGVAREP
jgi:hypothetical protein